MDDPGNLIYFAFLLISLIAGVIKNRKKKAAENAQPQEVRQMDSTDTEEYSPVNFEELIQVQAEADRAAKAQLKEMEIASQKAEANIKRQSRNQVELEEVSETISNDDIQNEVDEFDLKKAIIYSEILNPPHI